MNGSSRAARFWRVVSARTAREQPFAGDQTIVNSMLMRRQADGQPACAADDGATHLRHAHFPPHMVVGGPTPHVATSATSSGRAAFALSDARVHHATASGNAAGKRRALDDFLDAWLEHRNATRSQYGLPARAAFGSEVVDVKDDG